MPARVSSMFTPASLLPPELPRGWDVWELRFLPPLLLLLLLSPLVSSVLILPKLERAVVVGGTCMHTRTISTDGEYCTHSWLFFYITSASPSRGAPSRVVTTPNNLAIWTCGKASARRIVDSSLKLIDQICIVSICTISISYICTLVLSFVAVREQRVWGQMSSWWKRACIGEQTAAVWMWWMVKDEKYRLIVWQWLDKLYVHFGKEVNIYPPQKSIK